MIEDAIKVEMSEHCWESIDWLVEVIPKGKLSKCGWEGVEYLLL